MRQVKGLSLIEIIIVVAIIAILLTVSGFFLGGLLKQQRLNEGATTLGESIRQASNRARVESRRIEVIVENDKVKWFTKSDNSLIREEVIPNGVQITPERTFQFTGRGLPEIAVSFDASLNGDSKTVNLLPTGVVIVR